MGCCGSASDKEPKPCFKANVVAVNSKTDYMWHERLNHALCVSGGGSRALTFSMGCYRALHQLNLIKTFKAISAISGGAWCSSIFMFAKKYKGKDIDTDELLGPATDPKNLSMPSLQDPVAPLASGIVMEDSDKILAELAVKWLGKPWEIWPHMIAEWLYRNFDDLNNFDMYLALNQEGVDRIKINNYPDLENAQFLTPRSDRPETFIISGALLSPEGRLATAGTLVSFQMSAEYAGSPFYPNNRQCTYHRAPICISCAKCLYLRCKCKCCMMKRTVGGGFVESFAFGGEAPKKSLQSGGQNVAVGRPEKPFALPYLTGISSWAMGAEMNSTIISSSLNIRKKYWPVASMVHGAPPQKAIEYEFTDGGNLDNAGILALLQRKAKKILWICNSFSSLNLDYDWASATVENFNPQAAGVADQLYTLFGYRDKDDGDGFYYDHDTVFFQRDRLLPICQMIKTMVEQGKPAVISTAELFKSKMLIMENDWWGISSFEMDFILVYLAKCTAFEDQLPQDTKDELAKGKKGVFANYPIYSTEEEDFPDAIGLTTAQVNLLAAQAEYSIKMNADLLESFLYSTSL